MWLHTIAGFWSSHICCITLLRVVLLYFACFFWAGVGDFGPSCLYLDWLNFGVFLGRGLNLPFIVDISWGQGLSLFFSLFHFRPFFLPLHI